jgi:hypothetical protein
MTLSPSSIRDSLSLNVMTTTNSAKMTVMMMEDNDNHKTAEHEGVRLQKGLCW